VGRGRALVSAGRLASNQFEPEAADTLLDEALTILRARGDLGGIAEALAVKARAAVSRQDYLAARVMAEEAVTIAATHGDPELVAEARMMLAQACFYLGDYPDARRCLEEVVVYCASSGRFYPHGLLDWSGHVETACGDYVAARERYRESMRQRLMVDRQIGVAFTLSGFAGLAAAEGDLRRAARLSGTAARLCDLSGVPAHRTQEGYIRDRLPRIRAALGDAAYDAAWDEGQAMTLEEAVADALGGDAD
jgi:tetratricopeptide (TPR) repeat protein